MDIDEEQAMKNAVILHGTGGNSKGNWFPWLKKELEKKGYKVWVPDLPDANRPNVGNYNPFLFNNWDYNDETILIGHSSGSVAILSLLDHLPKNVQVRKSILVAGFTDDLGWDVLNGMFINEFNWENIKKRSKEFVLFHSDNDPYVDLQHGKKLKKLLNAKLVIKKGAEHFSLEGGDKFKELPIILPYLP